MRRLPFEAQALLLLLLAAITLALFIGVAVRAWFGFSAGFDGLSLATVVSAVLTGLAAMTAGAGR